MQIASAFATIQPKELPYQELCFSCSEEVRSILFENPNNAGYVDTKDLPPSGVFSFSLASPLTLHYTPYSTSSFPFSPWRLPRTREPKRDRPPFY